MARSRRIGTSPLLECAHVRRRLGRRGRFRAHLRRPRGAGRGAAPWTPRPPGSRRGPGPATARASRCGKMMNRVNFGRHSGTVIDVCRGHGTFLDAGELHAIVTFIRDGGLDRARAAREGRPRGGAAPARDAEGRRSTPRSRHVDRPTGNIRSRSACFDIRRLTERRVSPLLDRPILWSARSCSATPLMQ